MTDPRNPDPHDPGNPTPGPFEPGIIPPRRPSLGRQITPEQASQPLLPTPDLSGQPELGEPPEPAPVQPAQPLHPAVPAQPTLPVALALGAYPTGPLDDDDPGFDLSAAMEMGRGDNPIRGRLFRFSGQTGQLVFKDAGIIILNEITGFLVGYRPTLTKIYETPQGWRVEHIIAQRGETLPAPESIEPD